MIVLLGATTFVGQGFARALRRRKDSFIPLSQNALDYSRFEVLFDYVRKVRPELLINAEEKNNGVVESWSNGGTQTRQKEGGAGPSGAEATRLQMLQTNTVLPQTIAKVCAMTGTPWGHVSSGSIFTGAKIADNGEPYFEPDLEGAAVRQLFGAHPERFYGFSELDEPNFSFRNPPCTFYSGTKALAEEALREEPQSYVWRLRLPFNEQPDPQNLLSQLQARETHCDAVNSLSHVEECVGACLQLWDRRAEFGVYNVVNPGAMTTHEIVQMIQTILKPPGRFQLLRYDGEGNEARESAPRSNCVLDSSKLARAGIKLRPVREALRKALEKWEGAAQPARQTFA